MRERVCVLCVCVDFCSSFPAIFIFNMYVVLFWCVCVCMCVYVVFSFVSQKPEGVSL